MNSVQLTRANEIQALLKELNQHAVSVSDDTKTSIEIGRPNTNNYQTVLKKEFLPMDYKMFLRVYYMNLQARIKDLETEFNNL